jgi:hypothetical protein
MQEAQANQTKYAGGKEVVFEVGDKVWLPTWHFQMTRPSKILDYIWTGPYAVSKVINWNDCKLVLPYTIRKHNVSHLS